MFALFLGKTTTDKKSNQNVRNSPNDDVQHGERERRHKNDTQKTTRRLDRRTSRHANKILEEELLRFELDSTTRILERDFRTRLCNRTCAQRRRMQRENEKHDFVL